MANIEKLTIEINDIGRFWLRRVKNSDEFSGNFYTIEIAEGVEPWKDENAIIEVIKMPDGYSISDSIFVANMECSWLNEHGHTSLMFDVRDCAGDILV